MKTLKPFHAKMSALVQTLATLALLTLALPLNLLVVIAAFLWGWMRPNQKQPAAEMTSQSVLITGGKMTKALQLARSFHQAGHRVTLVETHKYWLSGHRFSRAVARFYTVPAPEKDAAAYVQALLQIVRQERVDVFIPVSSPVASYYDAVAGKQLANECQVLHFSPEMTAILDNKFKFCEQAHALGLSAPQVFLITRPEQVLSFDWRSQPGQFILKSLRYDSVARLNMIRIPCSDMAAIVKSLPISDANPWVMQQFITGQEYCTHSTVRRGKIRLHCCSRSSPFQVNYEHVYHPEIYAWVEKFVQALNLTGQISFDFIETADGTVYPIECNPRTHSAITMFYNHPDLPSAYLTDAAPDNPSPLFPLPSGRPTYWLYHELWRLTGVRSWSGLSAWWQTLVKGKDALLQPHDPLPFLMVPHWQITLLLLENLCRLKGWVRIDFNIGKLVELEGD